MSCHPLCVLITDVCCRVKVLKLPIMKCSQVWDLFMWLAMTKWINLTFPPVMPQYARFEAVSVVFLSVQLCCWVTLPLHWTRALSLGSDSFLGLLDPEDESDRLDHQQPLNDTASHSWRLEPVVYLRWHGSVSIWASLMIEYGDVIMWSRRW